MFDLETAIAEWRQQMLAAGIQSPAPLEELENHLREEFERLIETNTNPLQAFEVAVKQIGQPSDLKREFKKIRDPIESRLVRLLGAACVTVAFLFSLWISLFLFNRETGVTAQALGLAALAVTTAGWRYNHKFLPVIRHPWIRSLIGFACCIGGVIGIQLFIIDFVPWMMVHPHSTTPRGELMAAFLWGWAIMAILAGIGHGLEKAARKSTTT